MITLIDDFDFQLAINPKYIASVSIKDTDRKNACKQVCIIMAGTNLLTTGVHHSLYFREESAAKTVFWNIAEISNMKDSA